MQTKHFWRREKGNADADAIYTLVVGFVIFLILLITLPILIH